MKFNLKLHGINTKPPPLSSEICYSITEPGVMVDDMSEKRAQGDPSATILDTRISQPILPDSAGFIILCHGKGAT